MSFTTGRKNGIPRGTPNWRMSQNNQIMPINPSVLPTADDIVRLYVSNGSTSITTMNNFGIDPLEQDPVKYRLRFQSFCEQSPPFDTIFSRAVNGDDEIFKRSLLFFINATIRLAL